MGDAEKCITIRVAAEHIKESTKAKKEVSKHTVKVKYQLQ